MTDRILFCHEMKAVDFMRGRNCYLWDSYGSRYLDLESGSWSAVLGHCNPRITRCLRRALNDVTHLNVRYPNHLAGEAAERLLEAADIPNGKCVFLTSGSEAVEFAAQAARRATGLPLFLSFENSYLGAFGTVYRKPPEEWRLIDPYAADIEGALRDIPFGRIAAFLLEPGGGSPSFVRFPRAELVQTVAARVQNAGGLVVANEVTTGLGRTGTWFGYQHYGIRPDIVAIGKALGNGYPVSGVAMSAEVAQDLKSGSFHHAQSHQNNPLGCAVAREVLDALREEGWIERGNALGTAFLTRLRRFTEACPHVRETRGRGMLWALELDGVQGATGENIRDRLWEQRIITGYSPAKSPAGTGLRFDPALTLKERDLEPLEEFLEELLA